MGAFLVNTDDIGEAEEVISANFAKLRITAPRESTTRTRIYRSGIGSTYVDDVSYSFDLGYDMEAPDSLLLTRVRSGKLVKQPKAGESGCFGPGDVVVLGALSGIPFSGAVDAGHYDVITLDRGLLDEVAGSETESVRLAAAAPRNSAANQHLADAVDYVVHSVATNDDIAAEPLIAGAVARYLAASVLTAVPNSAHREAATRDRVDTTPTLLRRAMSFIEDNAHTDITLTDIAAAVYVTPRALQYMFRNHRDCTPMEYVRTVRLSHAHRELLAGHPSTTSVAAIARRWGFGHLGRFAIYYRRTYGQTPHVTLRG